jgi:hypothetical protein
MWPIRYTQIIIVNTVDRQKACAVELGKDRPVYTLGYLNFTTLILQWSTE